MKTSSYKGVTAYGNRWRAQIGLFCKPRFIGDFDAEIEAAKAYDNAAFGLNKYRHRQLQLNFPNDYYSGEHTPPELTERSQKLVQLFQESGSPRRFSHLRVLEIETLTKDLKKLFDRTLQRIEANKIDIAGLEESADRLAEDLYFLGDRSPYELRQATRNKPPIAPAWKCPGKNGCPGPCDCEPAE